MVKKILFVLMFSLFSTFIFNEILTCKTREVNYKGDFMIGFGRGRGGRGLGLGQRDGRGPFRDGRGPNPDCPLKKEADVVQSNSDRNLKRDGSGPFRDGRGPNPDCPLKKETDVAQSDSGRNLKRDGSGPNKDGQGPRESDLGPKEDCPKK
ncbi:hypothetical protein KAW80_01800 [Candidatus Babeliales bacterium]|nr:hypothetical protein [Candidatus Babeliales bacterium]